MSEGLLWQDGCVCRYKFSS